MEATGKMATGSIKERPIFCKYDIIVFSYFLSILILIVPYGNKYVASL